MTGHSPYEMEERVCKNKNCYAFWRISKHHPQEYCSNICESICEDTLDYNNEVCCRPINMKTKPEQNSKRIRKRKKSRGKSC